MTKDQYLRQIPQKRENKRIGKHYAKMFGILLKIHKDIDPKITDRNKALDWLMES